MTVMSKIGARPRCDDAEVEGFLLSCTNIKIKAEPSFFCPLTGCLLLSPVRLVNSNSTFEAVSLREYFKRAGRKQCPVSGRNLDKDWVVIEPDDELRDRIHAWAERKHLDLDALEIASRKLRGPKNKMLQCLSDNYIFQAAFPSAQSVSRTGTALLQKPSRVEGRKSPGRAAHYQVPTACAVSSAVCQLERPRSVSAPRSMRCSA